MNLGARGFSDASTTFFEHYPGAAQFEHHAFEAQPRHLWGQPGFPKRNDWSKSVLANDPRIRFYNVAVWTRNTTLKFGGRKSASHVSGASGASEQRIFGSDPKFRHEVEVPAIDLVDFLQKRATEDDFVLVKMDIEGSEFAVVPHLIRTGAACLIDEMYLECHPGDVGDIGKGRTYEECITMLVALRGMGVAAHAWF